MAETGPTQRKRRTLLAQKWVDDRLTKGYVLEAAPDPTGVMPNDDLVTDPPLPICLQWTPERWEAWKMVHNGVPSRVVAEHLKRQHATITEWRRMWFIRYGLRIRSSKATQLVDDPHYRRLTTADSPASRQESIAAQLEEAGLSVAATVLKWLQAIRTNPERLDMMGPKDVKELLGVVEEAGQLAARIRGGEFEQPKPSPAGSSAKAALTGLTGGKKTGRAGPSTNPAAASAGFTQLRGTLDSYRKAVEAQQSREEPAAG